MRAMNTLGEARVAAVSSTRCTTRSRSSIVGLPQRTKTAFGADEVTGHVVRSESRRETRMLTNGRLRSPMNVAELTGSLSSRAFRGLFSCSGGAKCAGS